MRSFLVLIHGGGGNFGGAHFLAYVHIFGHCALLGGLPPVYFEGNISLTGSGLATPAEAGAGAGARPAVPPPAAAANAPLPGLPIPPAQGGLWPSLLSWSAYPPRGPVGGGGLGAARPAVVWLLVLGLRIGLPIWRYLRLTTV